MGTSCPYVRSSTRQGPSLSRTLLLATYIVHTAGRYEYSADTKRAVVGASLVVCSSLRVGGLHTATASHTTISIQMNIAVDDDSGFWDRKHLKIACQPASRLAWFSDQQDRQPRNSYLHQDAYCGIQARLGARLSRAKTESDETGASLPCKLPVCFSALLGHASLGACLELDGLPLLGLATGPARWCFALAAPRTDKVPQSSGPDCFSSLPFCF